MIDGIGELWEQAVRLARPVASHRNPGVTREFVEQVFGEAVPGDVVDWFAWGNGVAHYEGQTQDDAALVPGYEPLSVAESAAIRHGYPGDPLLLAKWYPLLASGGGDFYAACYSLDGTQEYVVSVFSGEETRVAYRSIPQMIEIFRSCFNDGTFYVDEGGVLQADDERWIAKERQAIENS